MILKNIEVNNVETYVNYLIKELCKLNIPYIYIKESKELHFDNYIIRFFSNNLEEDYQLNLSKLFYEVFSNINLYYDAFNLYDIFIPNDNYDIFSISAKKYIKNMNNEVNIKFKNNNINNKILNKKLNPTRKIYNKTR